MTWRDQCLMEQVVAQCFLYVNPIRGECACITFDHSDKSCSSGVKSPFKCFCEIDIQCIHTCLLDYLQVMMRLNTIWSPRCLNFTRNICMAMCQDVSLSTTTIVARLLLEAFVLCLGHRTLKCFFLKSIYRLTEIASSWSNPPILGYQ